MLTHEERTRLMMIAREAIVRALHHEAPPDVSTVSGALARRGGAFVTIRLDNELRGCIGYIESDLSLAHVVAEVAVKAARDDPRFPPLSVDEAELVSLEVSVLSPMHEVKDPGEIQVGEHGLLLELGRNRGLLLPQVATEFGWGREEFLAHTARKAGLPAGAWRDPDAKLYLFRAEVCHEERE